MGGSSSKSKSDIFMESVNNAFVQSIQSCSMSSDVEQIVSVKGDGNILSNVELNQVYTSLLTCVQDVNMISKMQTDMQNAIKSAADSQSVALLGALGSSNSEVDSKIYNSVRNAINMTTMTQLVNNVKAMQTIYVQGSGNTLINVNLKQVNSNIASSSQQIVANIDVLNTIKSSLDQSSKSTQSDPISDLLNGLANLVSGPVMWFAIIIIGGLVILVIFLNTGAGATVMGMAQDQLNNEQYEDNNEFMEQDEMEPIPEPAISINQNPPLQTESKLEPVPKMSELIAPLPPGLPKLNENNRQLPSNLNERSESFNENVNKSYIPPVFIENPK